jgi:hypothetical protein
MNEGDHMKAWNLARGLALALGLAVAGASLAADGIESRPLQFAKGASSATVKGSIDGRQTVDYKLRAKAGQTMKVNLKSGNPGLAFNVLPPGSKDVAIDGAIGLQDWSGALPADGEYTVRTYLDRAAARRGEKASYTLTVAIDGAAAPSGSSDDAALSATARRAGEGSFDATGQVPCAQSKGQPMGQCAFGVARASGGTATVSVTRPDGRKRIIFFSKGKAVGADLSQADGNMTFRATKEADLFRIQAGDERYEIPEAAVFGG